MLDEKHVLFVRAIELMIKSASMTFPSSVRWGESLKNRQARLPLGSVWPLLWLLKILKQRYFKILLMSLIKTLFSDQLSSHPQMLTLLDFPCYQEPMLTIQSAISKGESVKQLLVPHNIATFFSDGGINRFLVCQSTFSAQSPPIPKFNAFNGVKYLCHNGISLL